jgi:hypothetical protein
LTLPEARTPNRRLKRIHLPFLFFFFLIRPGGPANIPCVFTDVERIIAVGDLHGDFENFKIILTGCGIADENLHWIAGRTHFVQTGDIMDRGPDAKKILDLLIRLEGEADRAGGMVHVLLGNHEELNITGIVFDYPDCVTIEQYISMIPVPFREEKEREFREAHGPSPAGRPNERLEADREAFWQALMKTEDGRQAYIKEFNRVYGTWLLEKNAVIKINGVLFAHGGIPLKYSTWDLGELNDLIRRELLFYRGGQERILRYPRSFRPKIVFNPKSPLWYRDFALRNEKSIRREFARVLKNLDASAMVIAHTFYRNGEVSPIISPRFMSRLDGKLWVIDTGISAVYGGANSALIIGPGGFKVWGESDKPIPRIRLPLPPSTSIRRLADAEGFLRTAGVLTVIKTKEAGRTEPWTVVLEEGDIVKKALFKYVDRPWPSPLPSSFRYELAAYALSKLLGLEIVPPVVERDIEGVPGSLQIFLENTVSEAVRRIQGPEALARCEEFRRGLDTVRIFCLLINDACDNLEDTLVDKETGKVFRVDFSEAFRPVAGLAGNGTALLCPDDLAQKIMSLDDDVVTNALEPYLSGEEIEALLERKEALIELLENSREANEDRLEF